MAKSRLELAKPKILRVFGQMGPRVLTYREIAGIVAARREPWRLAETTTVRQFIAFLGANGRLRQVVLEFPNRREMRYCWGDVSVYRLAMSLGPGGYLSHYAAMALHDLTDQIPKTVYFNVEQAPKLGSTARLEQERIDLAFQRSPRISRNVATYGEYRICLLNGMHTGGLGVVEVTGPERVPLRVTGVERTLIDIAVRPFYAGGVFEVLGAYRRAREAVSVRKLVTMLRELDYVYPYHQAIGFYLEKAGVYIEEEIAPLTELPLDFDFYLTHQMKKREYSRKWRLFFPKGL